jgi:hypothetical protein
MHNHSYLNAIETVLSWSLSESAFADALNQQVIREIGVDDEYAWDRYTNQSDFFH